MVIMVSQPGLFGLENTNRDFTKKKFWGKNQFNSSFPTALACYMGDRSIEPIYLTLNDNAEIDKQTITIEKLFGLKELLANLRFNFEADYLPHTRLITGNLPRVDLVTLDTSSYPNSYLRALEIKLTALPDNQTAHLKEDKYGSEIVVRPDTIVYLGLNIATIYLNDRATLLQLLEPACSLISDWTRASQVVLLLPQLVETLKEVLIAKISHQSPLLMQPIWKTEGKSGVLTDNCLDLFVWSDFGLTRLFVDRTLLPIRQSKIEPKASITRPARAVLWLIKMLYDFASEGRFNQRRIIDELTYDTKNDKAFAVGGNMTHRYMNCAALIKPRVTKAAIKEIILGGGEEFLSPERRLDATIISTPGLFD